MTGKANNHGAQEAQRRKLYVSGIQGITRPHNAEENKRMEEFMESLAPPTRKPKSKLRRFADRHRIGFMLIGYAIGIATFRAITYFWL
jgi:hypothetical protein